MTDAALRIGLVGYGFGGRYFHAPLIASAPGCVLAGVVTRSPDRRAEVAQDHPGVAVYDSIDDLAAAGVDAVTVSTPAATHTALTEELLRRGLPVVCDKPFAMDAPTARQTIELAEREGVLLSPYQNRRWDSDLLTIRRLLDAGSSGRAAGDSSRPSSAGANNPAGPAGGGLLRADFSSHLVDAALHLFGPVVRCTPRRARWGRRGRDDFLLLFQTRHRHALPTWSGHRSGHTATTLPVTRRSGPAR